MTHGSLFTGIGGFDLGFENAGIESKWQVESEPFCLAVLKTHWPNVRRFTDVRSVGAATLERVDVITGGFPCQDVSVAGKRAGLSASRTGLFFEVVRILGECQPKWFVLENVPGLLSSNKGEDFRTVIETLCDLGYGVAWRVLDSRYFGVAQRRRRVFIVGRFGEPCPAAVLFESESGERDSEESGEAGPEIAQEVAQSITQSCWKRHDEDTDALVASALNVRNGNNTTYVPVIRSLKGRRYGGYMPNAEECADGHLVSSPPDPNGARDFASLPAGLDSARYRALGNAVTASVAFWIGKRIIEWTEKNAKE